MDCGKAGVRVEQGKKTATRNQKGKLSALSDSDLENIDRMLLHPKSNTIEIVAYIKENYGIQVTGQALRKRRKKVRAENAVKEVVAHEVIEAEIVEEKEDLKNEIDAGRELAKASFCTMKQTLAPIMEMSIDEFPEDQRGMYRSLKEKIGSALRRAEEFYQTVDYFGYLNYAINAQQLRVAKGMEMELSMPMTMTNVTNDLKLLVEMIEKAIKIAQSLGLAPMVMSGFGNNGLMIQNNQFNFQQGGPVNVTERQKQMEKLKEATKILPPAKIEEMKRKFLAGLGKGRKDEKADDD